eukprot:gene7697-biopygen1506
MREQRRTVSHRYCAAAVATMLPAVATCCKRYATSVCGANCEAAGCSQCATCDYANAGCSTHSGGTRTCKCFGNTLCTIASGGACSGSGCGAATTAPTHAPTQ